MYTNKFIIAISLIFLMEACSGTKEERIIKTEKKNTVSEEKIIPVEEKKNSPEVTTTPPTPINNNTNLAPDITFPDVNGNLFSLSQLRGKYVLVDFWASWCFPCRQENPYVVNAYRKFKDKNFTVLGVSLDENRKDWTDAIKADKLDWYHISDLKGWNSEAVKLYGFEGIPYNVLIDPDGNILATELRGRNLEKFLEKTLK